MKRFSSESEYNLGPCALTLGTFDGLHVGHQALMRETLEIAREHHIVAAAFTFDAHPFSLLRPECAPPPILTSEERRDRFARLGMDALIERPFTGDFANLSPRAFAERLVAFLQPRFIIVGYNYTFGCRGSGNAESLCGLGKEMGFQTIVLPPVMVDGQPVSSTRIRRLLLEGSEKEARRLLDLIKK